MNCYKEKIDALTNSSHIDALHNIYYRDQRRFHKMYLKFIGYAYEAADSAKRYTLYFVDKNGVKIQFISSYESLIDCSKLAEFYTVFYEIDGAASFDNREFYSLIGIGGDVKTETNTATGKLVVTLSNISDVILKGVDHYE